jgi:peptidoglycan/LPS O-acetylase OafA/YrhL
MTTAARTQRRIQAIDLARGLAVCLMILSHGVNGLLRFDQFTTWGMVPIHAVTKISSSLFFLVFGVAMGVAFVPKTSAPDWPKRRNKLLKRGLVILFWYKVLTVVEMQHLHDWPQIRDALLYERFPSYVEILGFYAIALLWFPFFLKLWARLPASVRWASPVLASALAWAVAQLVPFGSAETAQALLVEHPEHYTWGQLTRAPLLLLGLLIGDGLRQTSDDAPRRRFLLAAVGSAGALCLLVYFVAIAPEVRAGLEAAARNVGKHPPELLFMLFSVGGALCLLALALAGGDRLAVTLRPVTLVGSDALQAFIFHILVIFLVLRTWLGYFHEVSYAFALTHAVALIFATAGWIWLYRRARGWLARTGVWRAGERTAAFRRAAFRRAGRSAARGS